MQDVITGKRGSGFPLWDVDTVVLESTMNTWSCYLSMTKGEVMIRCRTIEEGGGFLLETGVKNDTMGEMKKFAMDHHLIPLYNHDGRPLVSDPDAHEGTAETNFSNVIVMDKRIPETPKIHPTPPGETPPIERLSPSLLEASSPNMSSS